MAYYDKNDHITTLFLQRGQQLLLITHTLMQLRW